MLRIRTKMLGRCLASAAAALAFAAAQPAAQGSTRLPFAATFDSGNVYADWDGFNNRSGVTVVDQSCRSGRCLRAPLTAGTTSDSYGEFYFADHVGRGGQKVEEAWVTVWSKFDAGLTWPNRSQKIALLNLTDGVTSARRYQMMLEVSPSGQYFVERSDIEQWQFTGYMQNVGQAAPVRFGQWDRLKMYVKLNTPGASNGIARLWVNGVLKLEHTNINIRATTSFGMNKFILGPYATQSSPSNGVQWFDDVTLSTSDPDGSGLPSAPTNLRVTRSGQ